MIENPVQWWRLFEAKQYRTSEQVGKASIWNGRRAIGLSKCMGELRLHQKSTVRMTHTEIVIAFKIHKQKDHSKQTCWTWIHKGHTHTNTCCLAFFCIFSGFSNTTTLWSFHQLSQFCGKLELILCSTDFVAQWCNVAKFHKQMPRPWSSKWNLAPPNANQSSCCFFIVFFIIFRSLQQTGRVCRLGSLHNKQQATSNE